MVHKNTISYVFISLKLWTKRYKKSKLVSEGLLP